MSAHAIAIAITAFLASAVEMVEAVTIVLAVGITRGWPRALGAAACAVAVLAAIVAIAGPRLPGLVANPWLRLAVGMIALYVGLSWLRKAVLRAAGRKAQRDETAAFAKDVAAVEAETPAQAFLTAFNGVFVEGVEVVAIVLALGSGNVETLSAAAGGALLALALVVVVALIVHRPLSQVPENLMKYAVGVMVTSFGIFWAGEGVHVTWPASDIALLYLPVAVAAAALTVQVALQKRTSSL